MRVQPTGKMICLQTKGMRFFFTKVLNKLKQFITGATSSIYMSK